MNSTREVEHYATLFDNHFLLQGLCLHQSLTEHATPFHLWILCMDQAVEQSLIKLNLPNVTLLPLRGVESESLREVKPGRSVGEYCWTLTPFLPQFVFERSPHVRRVTYLDADLYVFDDPAIFFSEFEESSKHVLITDHAFAPEYEKSALVGQFCVQFLTFRNTVEGKRVMSWWQDRCIEWCYAREENGKFGDQKYLDAWPSLFGDVVHILSQKARTLAPWNEFYMEQQSAGGIDPVFYHFHDLRIHPGNKVTLYFGYKIGTAGKALYAAYTAELRNALRKVKSVGSSFETFPKPPGLRLWLRRWRNRLNGAEKTVAL